MKALRWIVVLAVLAYAAWLAWPLLQQLTGAPDMSTMRVDRPAGPTVDSQSLPRTILWVAAIGLFVVSAALFAGHNARAFTAYLLAFGSNVALMLLQRGGPTAMARNTNPGGIDPQWILLGGLVVLGLLMLAAGASARKSHAHA